MLVEIKCSKGYLTFLLIYGGTKLTSINDLLYFFQKKFLHWVTLGNFLLYFKKIVAKFFPTVILVVKFFPVVLTVTNCFPTVIAIVNCFSTVITVANCFLTVINVANYFSTVITVTNCFLTVTVCLHPAYLM